MLLDFETDYILGILPADADKQQTRSFSQYELVFRPLSTAPAHNTKHKLQTFQINVKLWVLNASYV